MASVPANVLWLKHQGGDSITYNTSGYSLRNTGLTKNDRYKTLHYDYNHDELNRACMVPEAQVLLVGT